MSKIDKTVRWLSLALLILNIIFLWAVTSHRIQYPIVGPAGPAGPQGAPGMSIKGDLGPIGPVSTIPGPPGIQGPKGDTMVNTLTIIKEQPTITTIEGTPGPQGNDGAQGPQGDPGPMGDPGSDGRTPELRTNPITGGLEWRYIGDDIWIPL